MSIEEQYRIQSMQMQKKVSRELILSEQGKSNKNNNQLRCILQELKEAENKKGKVFSFPRFIIDSWDYNDKLGLELLELAELYKKL